MTQKLLFQKVQLKSALNWLAIVEDCDWHIEAGGDPDYWNCPRTEAIEGFAQAMTSIVGYAIENNKELVEAL